MLLQELIWLRLESTGGVPEGGLAAPILDADFEPRRVHLSRVLQVEKKEKKKTKDGEEGERGDVRKGIMGEKLLSLHCCGERHMRRLSATRARPRACHTLWS